MTGLVAGTRVGKDKLDIHPDGEDRRLTGGRDGCRAIAEWSGGKEAGRVILEAAGRHHRALLQSLHVKGLAACVAHTRQSRDFAGAGGRLARTDRADAGVLAAFGVAFADLPAAQPRRSLLDDPGDMPVAREHPAGRRARDRQILSGPGDPVPRSRLPRLVAWIDKAIATYDREIRKLIAGEAGHAESYRVLMSIPGIGPVTAAALICWMGELGSIGGRQAAALIGVAPFARDSGGMKGARHISGGRKRPRDVLFMAAMTAMARSPDMKALNGRLRERGGHHKVALVAVMRKLIVTANALLRDGRMWPARAPG